MAARPEEVTPEEIRARMADTRADLATGLDRLADGLNPRSIVRRQLGAVMGRLHGHGDGRGDGRGDGDVPSAGAGPADEEEGGEGRLGALLRTVSERPALAAGVAAVAGAVVGLLLPGPRRHTSD